MLLRQKHSDSEIREAQPSQDNQHGIQTMKITISKHSLETATKIPFKLNKGPVFCFPQDATGIYFTNKEFRVIEFQHLTYRHCILY